MTKKILWGCVIMQPPKKTIDIIYPPNKKKHGIIKEKSMKNNEG